MNKLLSTFIVALFLSSTPAIAQPVTNLVTAESAPFKIAQEQVIGGEKDAGGCFIAAGYSWCEAKKACLRPWE